MYLCVRGTSFVSFYKFCIEFWTCSDSVVFFVFHFILLLQKQVRETCEAVGSFLDKMLQGEFGTDKTVLYVLFLDFRII